MTERLRCFKAYDIRGRVPEELNEDIAYKTGRAFVAQFQPRGAIAVGRDIRHQSLPLANAVIKGLTEAGADVCDIGLCGTEMVYFAASREGMGGGIMVTASHNPIEYNGMKIVREGSRPVSGDTGLLELERRVRENDLGSASGHGETTVEVIMDAYVRHLLSFIDLSTLKPLKIVVNAGNGCAGPALDALARHLPFEFVRIHHEPDGDFPNGIPNPLLEENRPVTSGAVRSNQAHLGVAWDGDYDRCFLFDENGEFIEGYYIVGLLAEQMLRTAPGSAIVHDPRLTWNTIDIVAKAGGRPVESKTGHAFIKERMRSEDAVYGGEMSAHHYFRDFAYCDSGMVPWLLIASAMCQTGRPLSNMVEERVRRFPCSGEINNRVDDPGAVIERVRRHFAPQNPVITELDGLSMSFGDAWRMNIRSSQTEPILRLNVESRGDEALMRAKTQEVLDLIHR